MPAYASREALMEMQFQKGIEIPILKTIDVFFSCHKIAWLWSATGLGTNEYPVNGLFALQAEFIDDSGFTPAETDTTELSVEATATTAETSASEIAASPVVEPIPATDSSVVPTATGCTSGPNSPNYDTHCPESWVNNGTKSKRTVGVRKRQENNGEGESASSSEGRTSAGQWKVKGVFSEFNPAAWVKDVNGECSMPAQEGQ
jgi:hypothetical protein